MIQTTIALRVRLDHRSMQLIEDEGSISLPVHLQHRHWKSGVVSRSYRWPRSFVKWANARSSGTFTNEA